jgi:hypothetical protein
MNIKAKILAGRRQYERHVNDFVIEHIDGQMYIPCEGEEGIIKRNADVRYGWDCAYLVPGGKVVGVAVRVQLSKFAHFETFTIRLACRAGGPVSFNTEFRKRSFAKVAGGIRPEWVVQAYIDETKDSMTIMGIVAQDKLTEFVESRLIRAGIDRARISQVTARTPIRAQGIVVRANGADGNIFAAVEFAAVKATVYRPSDLPQLSLLSR